MGKSRGLALLGLQWTIALLLIFASARLALGTRFAGAPVISHLPLPRWMATTLGLSELVAAVLFLIPPTVTLGGTVLLVIFAIALLIHILHGQFDVGWLVLYFMAVAVVVTSRGDSPAKAKRRA